jgi:hypothetical protein
MLLLIALGALVLLAVAVGGTMLAIRVVQRMEAPVRVPFERVIVEQQAGLGGYQVKAAGDFTGDGYPDIVALRGSDALYLFPYPDWTPQRINGVNDGEQAQAADIDHDGDLDVVVGGAGTPARWYENPRLGARPAPDGEWTEHVIGGAGSHDCEVADLNRDGLLDVAVQDAVFLQRADGTWLRLSNELFAGRMGHGTALADVNADGYPDLLDVTKTTPPLLVWYENPLASREDPTTKVWRRNVVGTGFGAAAIEVVDVNGDGRRDVLVASEVGLGGLSWYEAPADLQQGNWLKHVIDPTVDKVHQSSIMAADFDGDGFIDAAIAETEQSANGRIAIYFNSNGDGSNWTRQILANVGGTNPKLVDIDADGDPDIVNGNHGVFGVPTPLEIYVNHLH